MERLEKLVNHWWLFLIRGILFLAIAVLAFAAPAKTLLVYTIWIGIGFLIAGVLTTIYALRNREEEGWGWSLAGGILDLVLGLLFVIRPIESAGVLVLLLAVWLLISGIITIVQSFELRKNGEGNWWVNLLLGILTVVAAFVVLRNPISGAVAISWMIGLGCLLGAIFSFFLAFSLRKARGMANDVQERLTGS
jgi:uncharacterized membrane protein HdeD (DUF308 family)